MSKSILIKNKKISFKINKMQTLDLSKMINFQKHLHSHKRYKKEEVFERKWISQSNNCHC